MNCCIIQARMGSSRLPGKTLMKLNDELSTLHFVKNQLTFSKFIDEIIVATTDLEEDDVIEEICKEMKVKCFRGSSNDVLEESSPSLWMVSTLELISARGEKS